MSEKLETLKESFLAKKNLLESAKTTLKQEFIGIDKQIDQIIDNIGSWFTIGKIQDRPLVINLWGLTGVGKTSLIERLVEILNYKNSFYKFDL